MINIEKLIEELTLEEKACLLSGHKSWHTNKISRVDLPSIFLTDGPHGLRKKREDSKETGLGETGAIVAQITLFAVLVYELVGPMITKISLIKAGEILPDGKVSARDEARIAIEQNTSIKH